ncbi:hypothetical protein TOPH_08435 [Tolypocladium ophioglossoides CBS 100239]|uniref:WSC domain-containing protein n=1 Tax=Tolypocladium ophioglossoides (strain CBS 100239) TaxID=1163406 RepID=A0A0L0MYE7_TOLOC|nr:hypothetical protein TOPH_08435 [Tolypocladium ophioglossoides CBS 100239]
MRCSVLLALGAGQVALAAAPFNNETTTSGGRGPQPTRRPPPGGNSLPPQVGDFELYGCAGSSAGFPTFRKIVSTDDLTLEFCAASCPTRFFGTYDTDCYCGEELDQATTRRVVPEMCDIPCPGDRRESCGGRAGPGLSRRQSVPLTVVLSVYVRRGPTMTEPPITKTITRTTTGTITSCPPHFPHCPVGSRTTDVVTVTTEICPIPDFHKKKIVCFGDHCAPERPCDKCEHHRIVCQGERCRPEVCDNKEDWGKLVICKDDECRFSQCEGEECRRKIVCFDGKCAHERCFGNECEKKFVCHGEECKHEQCFGNECHKKFVCHDEDCKPEPPCDDRCRPEPPCHEKECKPQHHCEKKCPIPPPPKPEHKPEHHVPPPPHPPPPPMPKPTGGRGKEASPQPSGEWPPVQVAGSDRTAAAFNFLGAAVGLIFML